jgi:hypothetical protein
VEDEDEEETDEEKQEGRQREFCDLYVNVYDALITGRTLARIIEGNEGVT